MNKNKHQYLILLLTLFLSLIFLTNSGELFNEKGEKRIKISNITGINPPNSGTWTISTNTTVENEIIILNGSIDIQPLQTLKVVSSELIFNNSKGAFKITGSNGQLLINESSINVTNPSISNLQFSALKYMNISIVNSTVEHYKKFSASQVSDLFINSSNFSDFDVGLQVDNSDLMILDSKFKTGNNSISFRYGENLNISHSKFTDIKKNALQITQSNNTLIYNNTLEGSGHTYECIGINAYRSRGLELKNNTIINFHKSIYTKGANNSYISDSYFAQEHDSVFVDGELQFTDNSNNISIINNHIYNLTYDGIEIYSSSNYLIENNTIEKTGTGMHIRYEPIYNLTIRNNTFIESWISAYNLTKFNITQNKFINGSIHIGYSNNGLISYNEICGSEIDQKNNTDVTIQNNTYLCKNPDGNQDDTSTNNETDDGTKDEENGLTDEEDNAEDNNEEDGSEDDNNDENNNENNDSDKNTVSINGYSIFTVIIFSILSIIMIHRKVKNKELR